MRHFQVVVNGQSYQVAVEEVSAASAPVMNVAAPVAAPAPVATAPAAPVAAPAAAPAPAAPAAPISADGEKISAPMPGTILDIKFAVGSAVKKGDVLMILEAMKMENEIMSPVDGTVQQVITSKGSSVNSGDPLMIVG